MCFLVAQIYFMLDAKVTHLDLHYDSLTFLSLWAVYRGTITLMAVYRGNAGLLNHGK